MDGCKVGERRLITIPSELAYGDKPEFGTGVPIPPHAVLVYDVQLVEVERDLRMKILQEGSGQVLEYGKTGSFEYTGVLADGGEQFDASGARGPQNFAVMSPGVIEGWALGLPG